MCLPGRLPIVARRASCSGCRVSVGPGCSRGARAASALRCRAAVGLRLRRLQPGAGRGRPHDSIPATCRRPAPSGRRRARSPTRRRSATPSSSADIESAWRRRPLPWANAETGARGAITDLVEYKGQGPALPPLQATRESFDGVAPVQGRGLHGRRRRLADAGFRGAVMIERRSHTAALEFLPRRAHIGGD